MKRTLSLLLALIMVVTMVPAVFAETADKPGIDMDDLIPCEHTLTYTNNGDGTHNGACECGEVTVENEAHADEDGDNLCDACEATLVLTDDNLVFYRTSANQSGGDLMLGDDIRAQFTINAKNLTYDNVYLEVTLNGVTTTVEKASNSTSTVFRYAYVVPAAYLTTDIIVTIYGVKNNVTYRGEVLNFSVRKCVDAKMVTWHNAAVGGNASAVAQCNLAMSLLHYGARTQIQFGVNTDYLATDNLNSDYEQYLPTATPTLGTLPTVDTTGKQVTIYNAGLQLQEKVKLSTIFRSTTAYSNSGKDAKIEIKHNRSKDGEVITYTYTLEDSAYFTLSNTKNIKLVFDKIAPSQLRDLMEITVYENDVAVSATYIRSMDMIMNNSNYLNNETMRELVYAIMNYSDCAKVVFG